MRRCERRGVAAAAPPPSAGSVFSDAAEQAASLGAIGLAGVGAGVAYLASVVWGHSPMEGLVGVPVLYAVAVLGAGVCAFLLRVRGRVLDDRGVLWVAAGFMTAGLAAFAQGVSIANLVRLPIAPSASATAALYLLWHATLPLMVLGGLYAVGRTWLRRGAVGAVVLAIGVTAWDPDRLPVPELVDATARFTPAYNGVLWILVAVTAVVAALWALHSGRRPSRMQAWVLVALVLALLDLVVASGAEQFFEPVWWSSASLRAATFAVPAAGLLAEAGRLLHLLHQHERGLSERLQQERELATTSLRLDLPDPAVRRRIETALRPGAIGVVYQPVYSLATGDLAAVEALARFAGEPIRSPDVWFADAHAVGLGEQLELAAIDAALRGADQLAPNIPLAINVSPGVLVQPGFASLVDLHPGRQLVVEVTEHAAVDDYHELTGVVSRLRERGVRLAIDDAGAGFASMRHIVRLVPDIIKLDMSLTRDIHLDPVRRSLATSLVGFAEEIGALVVAEGIEHIEELRTWQDLGAHAAQGYLLARPGPLPVAAHTEVVPQPAVAIAHRPTPQAHRT